MPRSAITKAEAIEKLTRAVESMGDDDLCEVYHELFPEEPLPGGPAHSVRRKVLDHLRHGLEVEEVLDLGNVVFPRHRGVDYDEETDRIFYEEETDALRYAE
jgi:hypothetical protein